MMVSQGTRIVNLRNEKIIIETQNEQHMADH